MCSMELVSSMWKPVSLIVINIRFSVMVTAGTESGCKVSQSRTGHRSLLL
jgi:hypothetical protein